MKIGKKLIALFLGIVMVMSLLPMTAFAEGESDALPVCICETACTADSMNAACPVCGAEGALPEQCGYSAAPETAENEQVLYVQSLIDALPDADMITEDNADAVMDQLEGIDAAKMNLTDAELEALDFSRYIAVVSVLNALTSDGIVPMAAEDTGATITYKPEITWQRTKELVYSEAGLEGLYADAKTGYLNFTGTYPNYVGTVNWDFADISAKLDRSYDVIGSDNVWDYGKNTQYTNTDPSNTDGTSIVPQQGIFAATWNNRSYKAQTVTDNGNTYTYAEGQFDDGHVKSYTVRKFSGTFTWPEGYDLTSGINILSKNDANYQEIYEAVAADPELTSAFGGNKVIAVNDDMYVFVYKEGTTLNSENYIDYLAFWTGTAGKGVWSWDTNNPQGSSENNFWGAEWMPTTPVTYNNQSALRAFHIVKPNLDVEKAGSNGRDKLSAATQAKMNQSDGWYAFADGDAIATVLNNQYKDNVYAEETFHIDIYCFDTDKVGGMDELELVLTKAAPTQANVTVRYWLNAVGDDPINDSNFLGSTTMTNQEIGSAITLSGGTAVNQLNYKKADAIVKNSNNDVEDGIQMNKPFTVTADSEANIINVIYVPAGQKIVHLYAGESTVQYDGKEHTVKDVTIKESGYADIVVPDSVATTNHKLNDGSEWDKNTVVNIIAQRTEILPGIYDVNFTAESFVKNSSNQTLSNYTVIQHPGKLTITYAPSSAVRTYDFGVTNSYDVLEGVEKQAESITASVNYVTVENSVVLYTPQSVNKGETITLTLTYSGGYTCEKQISFYPATNVLYEESFMDNKGKNGNWMPEGANSVTVVNDNETTVYGYAKAYESFNNLSNGGALKATLNLNGDRRVSTSDAVTFTFTGTGFDLISECGTDTGMLVAGVQRNKEDGTTTAVKAFVVDTYFCGDGEIISGPGILDYQVPVIRSMDLPYGTYTVTVYGYLTDASGASVSTQSYGLYDTQALPVANSAIDADTILSDLGMSEYLDADVSVSFMDDNSVLNGGTGAVVDKPETSGVWNWLKGLFSDHAAVQSASDNGYINVYLDAFRVYQPLEDETNYAADEQGLKYGSVYDYVLASGQKDLEGEGFIESAMVYVEYDGEQDAAIIRDYKKQGPQNEVYLSNGSYVGFVLENYTKGQTVMVSAKAVGNGATLGYMDGDEFLTFPVKDGALSTTEMYYDVTDCVIDNDGEYIVVLGNVSTADGALLSISGIKLPTDVVPAADSVVAEIITKAYDKNETAAFIPETFTVSYKDTAKIGKYTTISIKTSTTDVAKVDVFSGETSLSNKRGYSPNNMKAVERGKAKFYSFNVSAMIDSEENIFYVVAYDSNGNASNPVAVTIYGK